MRYRQLFACLIFFVFALGCSNSKKWICSDIKANVSEKINVRAEDDFSTAVNKEKIARLKREETIEFAPSRKEFEKRLLELLADNDNGSNYNMKALFDLLSNWDRRNEYGIELISDEVRKLDLICSIEDYNAYREETPLEEQFSYLIDYEVTMDPEDPSSMMISLLRTRLLFGDPENYRQAISFDAFGKQPIWQVLEKAFLKLGYSEDRIRGLFGDCCQFEISISRAMKANKTYEAVKKHQRKGSAYGYESLLEMEKKLNVSGEILRYFEIQSFDRLCIFDLGWFQALASLYTDENIGMIKSYLIVHYVWNVLRYLDYESYESYVSYKNNSALNRKHSGIDIMSQAAIVDELLPWDVSETYCERYVSQVDKERIGNMCLDIIDGYRNLISSNSDFSEEFKENAIRKIENMKLRLVCPESWEPYRSCDVRIGSYDEGETLISALAKTFRHVINLQRNMYKHNYNYEDCWLIPPDRFNCFYEFSTNSVYFPCVFCNESVVSQSMATEERLARAGFLIAHEMAHSIDFCGCSIGMPGEDESMLPDGDSQLLQAKKRALTDYLANVPVKKQYRFDPDSTCDEVCADITAMHCLLGIAGSIPNFDYEAFFKSFADFFCEANDEGIVRNRIRYGTHPPYCFRVNIALQQFDEFNEAFGISEKDGMFLEPDRRVAVW